jgi:hypothetical protein
MLEAKALSVRIRALANVIPGTDDEPIERLEQFILPSEQEALTKFAGWLNAKADEIRRSAASDINLNSVLEWLSGIIRNADELGGIPSQIPGELHALFHDLRCVQALYALRSDLCNRYKQIKSEGAVEMGTLLQTALQKVATDARVVDGVIAHLTAQIDEVVSQYPDLSPLLKNDSLRLLRNVAHRLEIQASNT